MVGSYHGMIILCTYPDKKVAKSEAKRLIELRLAACASILRADSIFTWKGSIEEVPEHMAVFKTSADAAKELCVEIQQGHPYDTPEIIQVRPHSINKSYLGWLVNSTGKLRPNSALD